MAYPASDVEPESPQLVAAVVGDLVRSPRRHPDPVDQDVVDHAFEGGVGLVLDDVGQGARRRGQRHVDDRVGVAVEVYAVDQAQVDDVDPELGVDDVLERLGDVLDRGGPAGTRLRLGHLGQVTVVDGARGHLAFSLVSVSTGSTGEDAAVVVASFQAIQDSRAHLIRAGNLATPANAMPSSSTSSSGSTWPLPCIRVRNSSWIANASSTGLPMTRSVITDAAACEIEHPSASYETSSTRVPSGPSARCTRSVSSSPHVGLTWWTSASKGSRRPLWWGFL